VAIINALIYFIMVCSLFDREINNPNILSAPRQHTVTPLSTARRAFEEKLTAFRNQLDMLGFAQSARIKYVISVFHAPVLGIIVGRWHQFQHLADQNLL